MQEKDVVNQKLPFGRNLIYALQHVFVMVAGAVAVPLMVGGAAGVDTTFLISCALFAAGVATVIQCIGIGKFSGVKLAIVEGTSFASVTAMTGIVTTVIENGGEGEIGLRMIAGAVLVAGLFCFLMAGIWSKLLHFFPPVVTGTVVTVIGVSLFPIGVKWIANNDPSQMANGVQLQSVMLAAVTLLIILLASKFLKGILGNLSILIGIIGGTVIALIHDGVKAADIAAGTAMGMINTAPIAEAKLFSLVTPLKFGPPIFDWSSILSLLLVMLVIMTEATGNMIAISGMSGTEIGEKELTRGLRSSGLSTMFSAAFNSYPVTPFAQNVGMLSMTGVYSRFVTATAGIILAVLAFLPKFAAAFAAIPKPVLGGAGFAMFGVVAVGGIRTLGKVDYNGNKNNLIVAISLGLSLIPTVIPNFFKLFPQQAQGILHSGITIGCASAILLNLFFNVLPNIGGKKAEK